MSFFEFRRQITYKAKMRGGPVKVADDWLANSDDILRPYHRRKKS